MNRHSEVPIIKKSKEPIWNFLFLQGGKIASSGKNISTA